jgi:hypothetical protein
VTKQRKCRNWATAVGALAVTAGMISGAGIGVAPPARADAMSDAFLAALNNAGVGYDDPSGAVALGQSICPMLSQPGGSLAGAASTVSGNGVSPEMASLFTSIAISMYCPQMVASFANGDWLNGGGSPIPFQWPGLFGQ